MYTLTVTVTGDNLSDLDDGLEEVRRLVSKEYTSAPLNRGEGNRSFTFSLDGEETLLSSLNTEDAQERIKTAFAQHEASIRPIDDYSFDFEHGQWWVTCRETGCQWSVVDAEGGASVDGFDFEVVTEGSEE